MLNVFCWVETPCAQKGGDMEWQKLKLKLGEMTLCHLRKIGVVQHEVMSISLKLHTSSCYQEKQIFIFIFIFICLFIFTEGK